MIREAEEEVKVDSRPVDPERRRDRLVALACGLAALAVYLPTTCRTVYVGDSGEMAAGLATFGVLHPSGYPLYTLAGGLFVHLLPVGAPALRANLFSGVCAAGAVSALAFLLLDLLSPRPGRRAAAAGGALALAFATSFWQEATVARVYALNTLLSILTLRAGLAWARTRTTRAALATGLFAGLGLANHLAAAAALVAAVGAVLAARGIRGLPRPVSLRLAAGLAPGFALYLWLPLRTVWLPALGAGEPAVHWYPTDSLGEFAGYLLRIEYQKKAWIGGPEDIGRAVGVLGHALGTVPSEMTLAGVALAGAGIVALRGRRVEAWLVGLFAAVSVAALASHAGRKDLFLWDRYWIPLHATVAVLAGLGLGALLPRLPGPAVRAAAALALAALLVPFHWARCDRSGNTLARDVSRKILDRLDERAVLLSEDDNVLFPLLYLTAAEGVRPDTRLIPAGMRFRGSATPLHLSDKIYFTLPKDLGSDSLLRLVAHGLMMRALPVSGPDGRPLPDPPPEPWDRWAVPAAEDAAVDLTRDELERELLGHYFRMKALSLARTDREAARQALLRAEEWLPDDEMALVHVSHAYRSLGFRADADRAIERARAIHPEFTAAWEESDVPPPTGRR